MGGARHGRARPWHEPGWLASWNLTREQADAILQAIGDALAGRSLTRQELGDEVARRVGAWAMRETEVIGSRATTWAQLLGPAALTGRLCHGRSRGAQSTFVRGVALNGVMPRPRSRRYRGYRRSLRPCLTPSNASPQRAVILK